MPINFIICFVLIVVVLIMKRVYQLTNHRVYELKYKEMDVDACSHCSLWHQSICTSVFIALQNALCRGTTSGL